MEAVSCEDYEQAIELRDEMKLLKTTIGVEEHELDEIYKELILTQKVGDKIFRESQISADFEGVSVPLSALELKGLMDDLWSANFSIIDEVLSQHAIFSRFAEQITNSIKTNPGTLSPFIRKMGVHEKSLETIICSFQEAEMLLARLSAMGHKEQLLVATSSKFENYIFHIITFLEIFNNLRISASEGIFGQSLENLIARENIELSLRVQDLTNRFRIAMSKNVFQREFRGNLSHLSLKDMVLNTIRISNALNHTETIICEFCGQFVAPGGPEALSNPCAGLMRSIQDRDF